MMNVLATAVDFFLHLDTHLQEIIANYGPLTYAILFLIIFAETGLVVAPFLPGDSLLFAAGTFAGTGSLDLILLLILFLVAAIGGDAVNYHIGRYVGPKVFKEHHRFLNHEKLMAAEQFYEKHGGKAIILARFIPIMRTFAPFVAGIGKMKYADFAYYNVVGGVVWVLLFTVSGFFFGNIPFVRENFEYVILVIIGASFVPPIYEWLKSKQKKA